MKIVCASSVLAGEDAFSTLGDTVIVPDEQIDSSHLRDADVLVIRSKTPVTRELLQGTGVNFVGTATAGIDHLDVPYLEEAGLGWCAAPGCNANSVAEYVMAALLCLARRRGLPVAGRTLGIIGVGQVGSRVVEKAGGLGLRVLLNDPPRLKESGDLCFRPLDEVLSRSDILTLHVPLTDHKLWPTRGLANFRFFEKTKAGCVFINTSRGEVMDAAALQDILAQGVLDAAVLDVWDKEPAFSPSLLANVDLGTPHIAGYSFEGRLQGTWAVYQNVCRFYERLPSWDPQVLLTSSPALEITLETRGRDDEAICDEAVRRVYDIEADDGRLRAGCVADDRRRAEHFRQLRHHYPVRREFASARVTLHPDSPDVKKKLRRLGFVVSNT